MSSLINLRNALETQYRINYAMVSKFGTKAKENLLFEIQMFEAQLFNF